MNTSNSFIKLPRALHLSPAWRSMTGDQFKAFADLAFLAAFEDSVFQSQYGPIPLRQGQLFTTQKLLGDRWHMTRGKVRGLLDFLKSHNLISTNVATISGNQLTIVTVNHLTSTPNQASNQVESRQIKEINTKNSSSKEDVVCTGKPRQKHFSPPSPAEVQAYLDSKGETRFTGQHFCDYYEANGWTVGRNRPMVSWHGAVGTWIKHENDRQQKPQTYGTSNHSSNCSRTEEKAQQQRAFAQHIIDQLNQPHSDDGTDLSFL